MKEFYGRVNAFYFESEIDACNEKNANAIKLMHGDIKLRLQDADLNSPVLTFLDIDETLVHTIGNLINGINRGANILGFNNQLPPHKDIIQNGGTNIYASIFGMNAEDWEEVMIKIRRSPYVNEKADQYHPELKKILEILDVVGYISARPATLKTFASTLRDLFRFRNLPKRPVVLRPESLPITEASIWKSNLILEEFGPYVSQGARLVLVDDSISTAKAITKINESHSQPIINQILFKGPLTMPVLESGKYTPKEEDGIYVSDWENMVATFDRIKGK